MKLRWQNELLTYKDKKGKGYSPTYLKTVNCQLTAIFNYAMRYYNLQDNPCRKAGAIGKSKGEPKDFWMQEEFNAFLETVSDKPETRMAFLLLYWTGMRIGELLALTYNDINLEEKTISINKSYQRLKGKTFSVYQIACGTLYGYRNCAVWCKADTTS